MLNFSSACPASAGQAEGGLRGPLPAACSLVSGAGLRREGASRPRAAGLAAALHLGFRVCAEGEAGLELPLSVFAIRLW